MNCKFSPSLMCMDLTKFREQIEVLNTRADMYHVDIMDGHYVKNITLSPFFIEQLKRISTIPIDAHLMVENPADFVEMTARAGADYVSMHAETINKEAFRLINQIKELGSKVGIVINPATQIDIIFPYIHLIDKITVMSVDPGFAGQKFIKETLQKISQLKDLKVEHGYNYLIEIDGSCNEKTFKEIAAAGTEVFIIGTSGLFSLDEDIDKAWNKMMDTFNREVNEMHKFV